MNFNNALITTKKIDTKITNTKDHRIAFDLSPLKIDSNKPSGVNQSSI